MKERYDNLNGLRALSCIAIIAMHIKENSNYQIGSWLYQEVVASWVHLVALFLMISGFGMFCGYYEKFRSGNIDLNRFYTKRYKKILPFFITLILIDIVINRSLSHVIEGVMEATLVFGLLPNNQHEVIGVCWTLGVIFLFYMLFPFVVFLCWNKKRAVKSLIVSIIISLVCSQYYFNKFAINTFVPRHNLLYCAPWILGGGAVYLYRDGIKAFISRHRWLWLGLCISLDVVWHFVPDYVASTDICMLKNLIMYLPWLMYAISVQSHILSNKLIHYLSGISLEMYLAQMIIYRVIEKLHCLYLVGHGWLSFLFTWISLVIGLIAFIEIWKQCWMLAQRKLVLR